MASTQQYNRSCTLLVSTANQETIDLSNLRIKFAVKRSDTMTPNTADIRVYNLADDVAKAIRKEFTTVTLQAGYEGNVGVIFQGNIKQVILGRESATDTFIDIVAGDGDHAYNFAIVNTQLAAGSNQRSQIDAAVKSMTDKGVSEGYIDLDNTTALPRGKSMFGMARDYLRQSAQSTDRTWSIQDEKITFVGVKTYAPGEAVILTAKTGMIGTPEQTNEGVNVKCLLNPLLRISGRIFLDNSSVQRYKININIQGSPANIPVSQNQDGVYYILVVEHIGDSRGNDWHSNLVCLNLDPSENPKNSVYSGGGF